jgi:hypothetical protein
MKQFWMLLCFFVLLGLACEKSASGGVPEPTPIEQISGKVLELETRGDYYYAKIKVDDGEILEYRVDRYVIKVLSVGAHCIFEIYNPTSFIKEDVYIEGAECKLPDG